MKKIDIVRSSELKAGYSTPGIVREKAFESMHHYLTDKGCLRGRIGLAPSRHKASLWVSRGRTHAVRTW